MDNKEKLENMLIDFIEQMLKEQPVGQPEYVQIVPELAQVLVNLWKI